MNHRQGLGRGIPAGRRLRRICDDIDPETWRRVFQIADGHSIGEIPTLRPTPDYRRGHIPILEILCGNSMSFSRSPEVGLPCSPTN